MLSNIEFRDKPVKEEVGMEQYVQTLLISNEIELPQQDIPILVDRMADFVQLREEAETEWLDIQNMQLFLIPVGGENHE